MKHTISNPPHMNASIGAFSPMAVTSFEREIFLTTTMGDAIEHTIRAYPSQKIDIHVDHHPLHGTIEFKTDRTFIYQPNPSFKGSDTFSCLLQNGEEQRMSLPFTVNVNVNMELKKDKITVKEVRKEITKPPSQFKTYIGRRLIADIPLNEENIEPYTVSLKRSSTHGRVKVYPDGTFEYTPIPSYTGNDSFQISQHFVDGYTNTIDIEVTILKQPSKNKVHNATSKAKIAPKKRRKSR